MKVSSVQFSHSGMSNSLPPHESQHARPPCPSPTPGVYSNSCPSSWRCHPAISSSVVPFFSCPNPSQHQGLFQWVNSYQPRSHIKKQRHCFANKGLFNQGCGFSIWIWELDYKESWALKNWCFWTVMLDKTLERPLDCKEIQPVYPKRNQSWILFGRTDIEAETPILWLPDAKNWLIWKDPDAGKDWRWEKKGTNEDEMVGWDHWLSGRESEWTPGVGDGQAGLVCCRTWGGKESDTTERLNWTKNFLVLQRLQCILLLFLF